MPTASNEAQTSDLAFLDKVGQSDIVEIDRNNQAIAPMGNVLKTLQALGLAIVAGFVCNYFRVPVGWLVGPLLVGVSLAFVKGSPRPLPAQFLTLGKAIIGVFSASRFSPDTLVLAGNYAVPLLGCILITACLSILNGFVLWRLAGVDRFTSFLGTIPGSASNIVAISEDLGAEPVSVAILQYTRMMLIALLAPSVANWLATENAMEAPASLISVPVAQPELGSIQPLWSNLLFLVGCCSLGTLLGRWLRLPASAFLGSFLLGLTISWLFPHQFEVPRAAFSSALLLVGVSVGLRFSWQTVKSLWRVVLLEIGLIIILMLGCVAIGYEFHLVTHVDTMTALLGFVPGAIEAMVATATQLGGDTGTVVALQMTRQFLILLVINVLNVVSKQPDTTS
ncbi:MAG: AbrB family transcriptional regulator [Moorea sp. SIO2I5]|nr:AbrB family transcriptional regulator [Moorena sp. SIO2I5]